MNVTEMLPQLLSALLLVLGLMGALAWLARRMRLPHLAGNRESGLQLRSSMNLGQREKLVVVQFEGEQILLGVTASSINRLASTPAGPAAVEIKPEAAA